MSVAKLLVLRYTCNIIASLEGNIFYGGVRFHTSKDPKNAACYYYAEEIMKPVCRQKIIVVKGRLEVGFADHLNRVCSVAWCME